jgi:Holliday junction resolvase RusA-like endonuclease
MKTISEIKLLIPGAPVAQIRPRFSARLVKGKIIRRVVRDQAEQEGYFKQMVSKQLPEDFKVLQGPVILRIDCRLKRPKSHYGTGRNKDIVKKSAPLWPLKTPDWDNLGKFVSDCFNELIYQDDKQVISATVEKFYAKVGCTIVKIIELDLK